MKISGRKLAKRALIAVLLVAQLNSTTFYAWADAVSAGSSAAQALGGSIISPFSGGNAAATYKDIFPDYNSASTSGLQGAFGSDTRTIDMGKEANEKLLTEDSMEGEAYRVLQETSSKMSPDMSNDSIFTVADQVRSSGFMKEFSENFSDCSSTDVFQNIEKQSRVSKLVTCERLNKPAGNCEISHEILIKAAPVDMLFVIDNSSSMNSAIKSLKNSLPNLALLLGANNEGDLRLGGVVSRGDQYVGYNYQFSENVSAFGDWVLGIDVNGGYTFTVNAINYAIDTFSWRPGVEKVIVVIGNEDGPGGDVGSLVSRLNSIGADAYIFHNNNNVKKIGVHIQNSFSEAGLYKVAQFLTVVEDYWTPDECIKQAQATLEGFCTGSYSSTVGGDGQCVNLSGFNVCPGDAIYEKLSAPPIPNVDPLTLKVKVSSLDCRFNEGNMDCWIDPKGVERCPINNGGNDDTCKAIEESGKCDFISQGCIGYAKGSYGTCYVQEEVWDCGTTVKYPTAVNTGRQVQCPGGARCMGSECFDTSNTKSGDFAYAVAMLQVAQFAEHDLSCSGEGSLDCKIFKGEAMECKKALGGYVDCCEAPDGVSIFDYVNLTMSSLKMASSVEALTRNGLSGAHLGYWQAASSSVIEGAATLVKGEWSSIVSNATGAFNDTMAGAIGDGAISQIQGWLMEQAYNAMVDMGATTAANAIFQPAASGQGMALTSQAMAALNFIGMVYTIYVIADLLINIIWECEEKEFELGAKKETRQCHFVGSYCASKVLGSCVEKREAYCCFGSVVGRIIQEQGRPQLGMNFGSPESPKCEGLSPVQLSKMDWSKIDLSEWIGMLNMTGNLPTIKNVSLENRTGEGSSLGSVFSDTPRLNTLERNQERFEGVSSESIKRQAEAELRQR